MTPFHFIAIDAAGDLIEGQLEAVDFKSAIDQLLTRGLRVQSVREVAADADETQQATEPGSATIADAGSDAREHDLLQKQFAMIVQQADVIAPALEAYAAEMPSGRQRTDVLSLATQIRAGTMPVTDPAAPISGVTKQCARLACAAAASTDPAYLVRTLRTSHLATRARNATWVYVVAYPAAVLVLAFVMFVAFSKTVLPEIRSTYADFATEVPGFTAFVMRLSTFFENIAWPVYLFAAVAAIVGACFLVRRWQGGHRDRFTSISQLTAALSDLAKANLPAVDALRLAGLTCDAPLQTACDELALAVERGGERAAEGVPALPATLVYAMSQTQTGAARAGLLSELSTMYRTSSTRRISWCLMLLEPAAMVIVAVVAGFVVASVMLPLLSLITNLG